MIKVFKKAVAGIMAAILLASASTPQVMAAESTTQRNVIIVSATDTETAAPSTTTFSFYVESSGSNASDVVDDWRDRQDEVYALLASAGIGADGIESNQVTTSTQQYHNNQKNGKTTYYLRETYRLKAVDVDEAQAIIDGLDGIGAKILKKPVFPHKRQQEELACNKALAKAVEKARRKAETIAVASDREIDKVSAVVQTDESSAPIKADDSDTTSLWAEAGAKEVTVTVNVVFTLK